MIPRPRRFLPSPAMVVALTALVMSATGSAYALVVTGKSIRNNTVTGKDIRNRSLSGNDVSRDRIGGGSIKELSLGQVPSAAAAETLSHWVVVNNDGVLARGRGTAVGDPAGRTADGTYQVIFDRDVRGCAYQATLGNPSTGGPPQGQVSVTSLPSNVNGVRVRTANGAGAVADRPFHLIVSC